MTKFIFTVTTAVATMLGQVYNEKSTAVTESVKVEKMNPKDSVCTAKKELHVLVRSKKQLPS